MFVPQPLLPLSTFGGSLATTLTSSSDTEAADVDAMKTTKAFILFCTATTQHIIQEKGQTFSTVLQLSLQTAMITSEGQTTSSCSRCHYHWKHMPEARKTTAYLPNILYEVQLPYFCMFIQILNLLSLENKFPTNQISEL